MHYVAFRKGGDYAAAFELAKGCALEVMEVEARRRAVAGWDEPVFQSGEHVGDKRKFSDVLLIFMLKAADPDKYADRHKTELTVTDPVTVYLPENNR